MYVSECVCVCVCVIFFLLTTVDSQLFIFHRIFFFSFRGTKLFSRTSIHLYIYTVPKIHVIFLRDVKKKKKDFLTIVNEIENRGYNPEVFTKQYGYDSMSYKDLQALLINSFNDLDIEKQTNDNAYKLNEAKDMLQDAMDKRLEKILQEYRKNYCKNLTEFEISLLNPKTYTCY